MTKTNTKKVKQDSIKEKNARHDEKRKVLPRLPSSRIIDAGMAKSMDDLYALGGTESKLNMIVDAAQFALENAEDFTLFREKLHKAE